MTDITTVYDAQLQPQHVGAMLARGGEGSVYPLSTRSDVVVKVYHPQVLAKRGPQLHEKIEAMCELTELRNNKSLGWPLLSIYDANKNWLGYAMYRVAGHPMFNLAHAMLYKKYFPNADRRHFVDYLIDLLKQVQVLHSSGVLIGDYNLQNIMCVPNSHKVHLIDCDSFQMRIAGKHYPCPVGSADMTPKEQQGQSFSTIVRTLESEHFSIAIILFKCLMLGRHPYDIVGGADPVSNLTRGEFAYGIGNRGIPKGHWYNIWSHMPHRVKSLFITTFTEGADNPAKRATIEQWLEALTVYRNEIDKGWHEAAIIPRKPKSNEYRGQSTSFVPVGA